ncbi:hypothetical protein [Actinoplanes aureus]|uniref:Peptidase MA-like domain-containing protein n=1 Tax=Actinoplanes aureus TaxID=2792083 RepID=A0A931CDH2_9ACTN|nr:hypothetical protein [Actinoplanes aureus]MBG0565311.1 hypothetical protein [Actinoplanes aureus]
MEDRSPPVPPSPERKRKSLIAILVAFVVLAGGGAAAVLWPEADEPAAAVPTPKPSRAPTPFERGLDVLEAQAAALSDGDEKAFLAPVDAKQPKLVARYRTTFRNLRGIGIGQVEYHGRPGPVSKKAAAIVSATLSYCFQGAACPQWRNTYSSGPPKLYQDVTFTQRGDRYVITGLETTKNQGALSAPPWEGQALSFATGKRVIVAGPGSQKKHLKKILKVAEKAALVTDRYAVLVGNKQAARYRIYLADDKSWKSWYGGNDKPWAIGYALPLNSAGTDIVLRTRKVLQEQDMSLIIQHELAHVVTLAGLSTRDTDDDQWLVEGIAEYIGAYPKKPQNTYSRYALAEAFQKRGAPKSIAVKSLTNEADDLTVSTLYAMGHYASACMATKYGEPKLMRFADLVLRKGRKPAEAAPEAFGQPFKTVDKACLSWIKSRV